METLLWSFVITSFLNGEPFMRTIHEFRTRAFCEASFRIAVPHIRKANIDKRPGGKFEVTECVKKTRV